LGVQGLDSKRLAFLGRLHDGRGALGAVETSISAGFSRVSADLIFGVAGQTPDAARREALSVAALGPTHVSAYALTIEPGTRFGELARAHRLPLLSDDAVAASFEAVHDALTTSGFEHYEISNFARDGHYAEHNLHVWRGGSYLGLGAGAWGTVDLAPGRVRYRNVSSVVRYLGSVAEASLFQLSPLVAASERSSPEIALSERVLLGLRLREGVDFSRAEAETGATAWTAERQEASARLIERGDLIREGETLRIPPHTWLFADRVVRELI
jgi:oxygen-independent coproporphyrinogen-3 oxidase